MAGSSIIQNSGLRVAPGVGLAWKSPMGPIAVDLAFPVMKDAGDKVQMFHFNFGTKF